MKWNILTWGITKSRLPRTAGESASSFWDSHRFPWKHRKTNWSYLRCFLLFIGDSQTYPCAKTETRAPLLAIDTDINAGLTMTDPNSSPWYSHRYPCVHKKNKSGLFSFLFLFFRHSQRHPSAHTETQAFHLETHTDIPALAKQSRPSLWYQHKNTAFFLLKPLGSQKT